TYAEPDVPQWVSLQSKMGAKEASYMPERVEPPASPERVRETGVFMGDAKQHYGHFITDGMSRMWALPDMARPVRGLVHMPPAYALSFPHVRAVWEVMGFPPSTLEEPSRPTLFERVICPVPAIQISRRIYREFDRPHRLAARAILGGDDRGPKQGVYLSRGRLGAGHRQLEGESELEARLEKEGYRIVHPETLTFPEQMRLFNGDAPVVGATGSALHTVLFRIRRRGQTMAVLTPEDVGGRFPMIDMLKGSCTTYVNSLSEVTEAEDVSRVSTAERRFRIDPDRTMALLDGARFFRRRW
ncbi:MAG: glycosyltransferase family 61 protein, partial [Caulobacteraceae bacterium]